MKVEDLDQYQLKDQKRTYKAELVLLAMGFTGSQSYIKDAFGVESDARTNIKAEETDFKTNVPKVFATGDARRGQSLVVTAINEGIQAGIAVNKFLRK